MEVRSLYRAINMMTEKELKDLFIEDNLDAISRAIDALSVSSQDDRDIKVEQQIIKTQKNRYNIEES